MSTNALPRVFQNKNFIKAYGYNELINKVDELIKLMDKMLVNFKKRS